MSNPKVTVDDFYDALDRGKPKLTKFQVENIANACNGAAYLLDKNPFMEGVGNIALEKVFGETPPEDCVEVAVMGAAWVMCFYMLFDEKGYAGSRSRDAFLEAGQIMNEYGETLEDEIEELETPDEWSNNVEIEKELYYNSEDEESEDDDWSEDTNEWGEDD